MANKMVNLMDDLMAKKETLKAMKAQDKANKSSKKQSTQKVSLNMKPKKNESKNVVIENKYQQLTLAEKNLATAKAEQESADFKRSMITNPTTTYSRGKFKPYPGFIYEYLGEKPNQILDPEKFHVGAPIKNFNSNPGDYTTMQIDPSLNFDRSTQIKWFEQQAKEWEKMESLSDAEFVKKGYGHYEEKPKETKDAGKKEKVTLANESGSAKKVHIETAEEKEAREAEEANKENKKAIEQHKSPEFHDLTQEQYKNMWGQFAIPEYKVEGGPAKPAEAKYALKGLEGWMFTHKGKIWDKKTGQYVQDKTLKTIPMQEDKTVFNGVKGRKHAELVHDKDNWGKQDISKEDINRGTKAPDIKYNLDAANIWEPVYSGQAAVIVDNPKDKNPLRIADTRETSSLVKNILRANADSPEALARLNKEVLNKKNALSDLTADMVTDNYAVESHIKEWNENGNPVTPTQVYKWNKDVLFDNAEKIGVKGKYGMIPEQGVELGYFSQGKKVYSGQGQTAFGKPNRDVLRGGELFKFAKEGGSYDWDAIAQHYGITSEQVKATVKPYVKATDAELDAADKAFEKFADTDERIAQAKNVTAKAEYDVDALGQLGLLRRSMNDYAEAYKGEKKNLDKNLGTSNLIRMSKIEMPYSIQSESMPSITADYFVKKGNEMKYEGTLTTPEIKKDNTGLASKIGSENKDIKQGIIKSIDPIPGIAKYLSNPNNASKINPVDHPLMASVKMFGLKSKKDLGEMLTETTGQAVKSGYKVGTQNEIIDSLNAATDVLSSPAYAANKKLASGKVTYGADGTPYVIYDNNVKDVSENSGLGIKFTPDMSNMFVRAKGSNLTTERFMKALSDSQKKENKVESIDTTATVHKTKTSGSELAATEWNKKSLAEKKDELEKGK